MLHNHALVWVDEKKAHIYRFNVEDVVKERIYASNPFRKIWHEVDAVEDAQTRLHPAFVEQIGEALQDSQEWLLVGPGDAKNELRSHLEAHVPTLAAKLVGVESMEYPTATELLHQARRLFQKIDNRRVNSTEPRG